jgi:hypothetical protein
VKAILDQLARSGLLWDDDMVVSIFAGDAPAIEEIVTALVVGAMDAEAMVRSDATSSWNDRRIARQCLAIAFLTAIACTREQEDSSHEE